MNNLKRIAIKELFGFFSSLTAFIFFGVFLAVTLFIFFWVDTFFSRNIADVRPMFEWMPLLLVFLVPTLTMRMWSEERRAGTLEFLLTVPVSNLQLVLGKFVACMGLILIALALTIPIPVTVALLAGQLDWGPVVGGYIASLFLAAAYTAIGLNISARTDNQIVSLLLSVLVCGLFLLIGTDGLTSLFNNNVGEILKLLGSGSRFQSITRGVIDFRDLYYYVSIAGVFLSLNILGLEKLRWSGNRQNERHKRWLAITALCIANFVAGNFWLQQITWARVDLTAGQLYSISPATRKYLGRLKEPLLIRGYFSKKTHPYLQPLVPRLRDLLKEYAIAGNGKVHVEFVDPLEKPELEKEAGEKYGIKPVVFQTASKYQAALTNSYFDILIKYGDQFQKINWKDLIEIKARNEKDVSIDLRNPEYDITSTIKKLLLSYQGSGNLFLGIDKPVKFIAYVSDDDSLPPPLVKLKEMLGETLETLKKQANGQLSVEFLNPDADGGKLAKKLEADYGFRPMSVGVFNARTFWFYPTLTCAGQMIQVSLPDTLEKSALQSSIEAALKHFSKGFLKTIGISVPRSIGAVGMARDDFTVLRERLREAYNVEPVTLDKGVVPPDVDLLLLIEPERFNPKQLFAVDQFLMKGGSVVLATAPFAVNVDKTLNCRKIQSGLESWLRGLGIDIETAMVLDKQNFPLPLPTHRVINGFTVEETQLAPYPYFVDVRSDGMGDERIAAGIDQVIMNWSSAITIDKDLNKQRKVISLLSSSPESWTSEKTILEPDYTISQPLGFPIGKERGRKLLAVAIEGSFPSYFKDKECPLLEANSDQEEGKKKTAARQKTAGDQTPVANTIEKSPDSARIILFASNSFLADSLLLMASETLGSQYLKPVELIQNAADWSLEDRDLLAIRGRGHFARPLKPMTQGFEVFFEYLNYGLSLAGLFVVWLLRRRFSLRNRKRFEKILQSIGKESAPQEVRS